MDKVQTFKEGFFDASKVDDREMKRATLEGLVRRLSPGAAIVNPSSKPSASQQVPFLAEDPDSYIAYFRPGALTKDALAQIDVRRCKFEKPVDAFVILDLRGLSDSWDYETSSEFAVYSVRRASFVSIEKPSAKQEAIFTSNQDTAFQGAVVLLDRLCLRRG